MSEELTKLAKLANNAAGDFKPNSLSAALSPQNFGKYHPGGPVMGPVMKDMDKAMRVKAEMGYKLENMREENSASYNNLNNIDRKEKDADGVIKKEENGGVFHENTEQQMDMKSLPASEKLCPSPNWGNKHADSHGGGMMGRENNRIDGSQYPAHMQMQYPRSFPGPNQAPQSHVFSTLIANQAAKAVYTGQTNSIITFHQSLTAKRKFLDPEQDIKLDAAINQPPSSTPTPPQPDATANVTPCSQPSKHDATDTMKTTNNVTLSTNGSNGQKEDTNGPASNKSNPKTPQGNSDQPPRPLTAPESVPTTTTAKRAGAAKRGKRKRSQSTTQPLHPTMPPVAAGGNMAMQQGMPPSGPSFAPFPRGSFGNGPYPPQNAQMRPGMSPVEAGLGPSTTETENLDPSALWENPPSNKRRQMMNTMAPSWTQQQEFAMGGQPPMGPQGPGMMPPRPDGMMNQRAFMNRPHDQLPGGPPYDMAGFNPGQPMDNLTPEQMRHREERLRTLKEMQKMLFPEDHQSAASPAPGGMLSPHGPLPPEAGGMMNSGMVSPSGMMMGPGHPMMAMRGMSPAEQQRFMMSQPSMAPPLPQDFETMTPEQKAWVKLQQEFYVEKQRKMMEDQAKMQQSHLMDFPGRGPPMRFGPGPYPPGDPMGQAMPPPPPYHASAASILQRRASMSGSFSPGGGGPPFGPMSPHAMSATQAPAARLARSNSLPSAQMPMGPGGPMQGSLSPESRAQFRASTPTPVSLTAGGSAAGMNPVGGPMSAPAMTSNSPGMALGGQGCETMVHTPGSLVVHSPHPTQTGPNPGNMVVHSPHPSQPGTNPGNMVVHSPHPNPTTPGSMVVHSPHPNQPVTAPGNMVVHSPHPNQPVATPGNMVVNSPHPHQPVTTPGNMVAHSPHPTQPVAGNMMVHSPHPSQPVAVPSPHPIQPGTPVMDHGMTPPGATMRQGTPNTPSPAVSIAKQAMVSSSNQRCSPKTSLEQTKPIDTTPSTNGDTRKTTPGDIVSQQQKLVNFPASQLNRDKAPNFPPRGEDLQQYTSTFYQKTKEQPGTANRGQFVPSSSSVSPMNSDVMNPTTGGMLSSETHGIMNNSPAATIANRIMAAKSHPNHMTPQSTSQGNLMTSQPNMMTSQAANMMTSQTNVMTPMSGPPTTRPRAIAPSQPPAAQQMSVPQNMSTRPNMMSAAQSRMMSSHMSQAGNMMAGGMIPSQGGGAQGGMVPGGMVDADGRTVMSPRMMTSQVRGPISSNGPMMGMRMPSPGMMDPMMSQGRTMMGPMNNPEMMMQHKMLQQNMGPPMDTMGQMDMVGRFPKGGAMMDPMMSKGAMMDGMMTDNMDQVMDHHHPMTRQMMPGMRQPQPTSPLSLLQTRFSPPLPPDGKGPTKTLQYFPPGTTQVQGQGGNPHLNPNQPSPGPVQGPKQIQMPFPMEMITSGPASSPSLSHGTMGPHRMMGPRMIQGDMMYHHPHGDFGPRGPGPVAYMGPRPGMPYMQHPNRMPGGMGAMGMQPGGYMDPGFGPQMMGGPPMGPGYNMPR